MPLISDTAASCCPTFDMSTTVSFPVSMQNRAYRARDLWPVFMLSAGCSCCRGVRHRGGRAGHQEWRRRAGAAMRAWRCPEPAKMIIRQGRA
jgi:hypothetical protein